MVYVAEKFDLLSLQIEFLHKSEWIILAMFSSMIKVREIFQVGLMPAESIAAEYQDSRPLSDLLGFGQSLFEGPSVVKEFGARRECVAIEFSTHPILVSYKVGLRRVMLAEPQIIVPRFLGIACLRMDRLYFHVQMVAQPVSNEINPPLTWKEAGLVRYGSG